MGNYIDLKTAVQQAFPLLIQKTVEGKLVWAYMSGCYKAVIRRPTLSGIPDPTIEFTLVRGGDQRDGVGYLLTADVIEQGESTCISLSGIPRSDLDTLWEYVSNGEELRGIVQIKDALEAL